MDDEDPPDSAQQPGKVSHGTKTKRLLLERLLIVSHLLASQNPVPGEGLPRYDPVAETDHLVLQVVPDETPSVGCESSGEELGATGWIRDDESVDTSVKTECVSIDSEEEEEEEERSVYDCPHTLQVDFGDGEMATGYRG